MSRIKNAKKIAHSKSFTDTLCALLVLAVFISFCGWCLEMAGLFLLYRQVNDRGFLTLPLCPIYGTSIVGVYLLLGTPKTVSGLLGTPVTQRRWWRSKVRGRLWLVLLLYFITVTAVSSSVELAVGLIAKAIGTPLWDYSERAFNLFGVICLEFSLMWGALITAFMLFLWEPLWRAFRKIPTVVTRSLAFCFGIAISVDFLVNVIYLFAVGNRL